MPDRLTIRTDGEGTRPDPRPFASLKFRMVQAIVLLAAILFADSTMTGGEIRQGLSREAASLVAEASAWIRRTSPF